MDNNQTKNLNGFFDERKSLSELLNEAMDLRGLDVKKLSELTDIPVHYLSILSNGEFEKLPAVPYVRGYLARIAEAMRIDADIFLKAYKQEILSRSLKTSGSGDKLPANRFVFKNSRRRKILIVAGVVLILIIAFFIWRFDEFWGTPTIQIISPAADNLAVSTSSIKLSGEVNSKDKLSINGEEILVEQNGQFNKDFSLQSGINTFEFKVKRFLGKEIIVRRQVIYQPPAENQYNF